MVKASILHGYVMDLLWICNGFTIAHCKIGKDAFCKVKNGIPSNFRSKWKKTYTTIWDYNGLAKLFQIHVNKIPKNIFKNDYPDLKFGYQGSILSGPKIKEIVQKAFNEDKNIICVYHTEI